MDATAACLSLGLDIGGSSVKAALTEATAQAGPVIRETRLALLHHSRLPAAVIEVLTELTNGMRATHGPIHSIGIGLPGLFDEGAGTPTLLPNFPKIWHGFPFRDAAEAALGQRVTLANDAKAFSLAEAIMGAGRGLGVVACFVLGTGVGGGVVINGRLWQGVGYAGEFGHLTVDVDGPPCGCGSHGCVESFAGAAAICRAAGRDSVADVFAAAAAGDPAATEAVRRAVRALAAGMSNVFVTLAPDAVIVGGGVAGAGAQLLEPLEDEIRARITVTAPEGLRVLRGALGRYAGATGAALIGATSIRRA